MLEADTNMLVNRLERMIQCFPDRDEKDLMVDLQKMVSDNYQHFIEVRDLFSASPGTVLG